MKIKISLKAGGVLFEKNGIYIVYRGLTNDYSLPKGRLEEGETLKECAIRELKEEIGMNVEIIEYCDKVYYSYEKDNILHECIVFFYIMKRKDNTVVPIADDVQSYSLVDIKNIFDKLTYDSDCEIVRTALKLRDIEETKITALYEKILGGEKVKEQKLDFETIVWISKQANISIKIPTKPHKFYVKREQFELLKNMIVDKENYLNTNLYNGIHGAKHSIRVGFFVILLHNLLNINLDKSILKAALTHDVRRKHDGKDTEHGERCASWYLENTQDHEDKEYISQLIKYHDTDYENIPKRDYEKISLGLDILKIADALDRYRLPKQNRRFNEEYLRIPKSIDIQQLVQFCGQITLYSELLYLIRNTSEETKHTLEVLRSIINE